MEESTLSKVRVFSQLAERKSRHAIALLMVMCMAGATCILGCYSMTAEAAEPAAAPMHAHSHGMSQHSHPAAAQAVAAPEDCTDNCCTKPSGAPEQKKSESPQKMACCPADPPIAIAAKKPLIPVVLQEMALPAITLSTPTDFQHETVRDFHGPPPDTIPLFVKHRVFRV